MKRLLIIAVLALGLTAPTVGGSGPSRLVVDHRRQHRSDRHHQDRPPGESPRHPDDRRGRRGVDGRGRSALAQRTRRPQGRRSGRRGRDQGDRRAGRRCVGQAGQGGTAVPGQTGSTSFTPDATETLEALFAAFEGTALAQALRGSRWGLRRPQRRAHLRNRPADRVRRPAQPAASWRVARYLSRSGGAGAGARRGERAGPCPAHGTAAVLGPGRRSTAASGSCRPS